MWFCINGNFDQINCECRVLPSNIHTLDCSSTIWGTSKSRGPCPNLFVRTFRIGYQISRIGKEQEQFFSVVYVANATEENVGRKLLSACLLVKDFDIMLGNVHL
ncbi:hypothetical protein HPP92_007307 [Vanilla planifolia]|uniref:Uncharacterized protein n=1 Tax=Vanilla planifolia TaxID=51239 RepID=A0A835R9X5_VANPL|nr:hypothetical protein HPP92_007307 [Vanilla planifolia]